MIEEQNLSQNKQNNNEEDLKFILENYHQLAQNKPIELSEMLSSFADRLIKRGIRDDFIKVWMNEAIKLDSKNAAAHLFLTKYNWTENEHFLNGLTFPPIRESDNPSARKSKVSMFKEICYNFLEEAEEKKESLTEIIMQLDTMEETEYANSYSELLSLIGELDEIIVQFIKLLNDYEETASRTFYNTQFFEEIQKTLTVINDIKTRWSSLFVKPNTDVDEEKKTSLQTLDEMVGLVDVKGRIQRFYDYLKFQKQRKKAGFRFKDEQSLNMIFLGNPGTGKTTLARLLAKVYHELGVLPREEVVETNRSQLIGSFVGQTEENVRMMVEKALGGVLFIDEAYSLKREGQSGNDYGQTAIDTLVSLMTSKEYGGKFSVILAGYPEEMRQFLDSNTGLRSRFPVANIIELPDYSMDELIEIAEKIALDNDFLLTNEGKTELQYLLDQERVDHSFGNARSVQNLITQAIFNKGSKPSEVPDFLHYSILDKKDFIKEEANKEKRKSPTESLNELIGLKEVKETVTAYVSFVQMQTYRRDQQLPYVPIQLHSIFTGNPGTGKTTVAKIYSELLKECGLLKRGHLVVVGRADLIAGYVGQSAIKTKRKIREALGGVLFIDEAYSLFREHSNDYGKEVVDTIVDEMTKHGENLVVILAGYPKEMENLLESNPGLKSRFKKFFHFPDYSVDELIAIMKLYAKKYAYSLEDEGIEFLREELLKHPVKGNGRFAENIIHEAIQQQALRLMKHEKPINDTSFNIINKEDIQSAFIILKKGE